MDETTFLNRLQQVTIVNRDFAALFVSNHLPESNRYIVRLNQSCDEHLEPGEHVFPHDSDPELPLTAQAAARLL